MVQLNAEQIYPVQSIYIPQVYSVRLRTDSGLPRTLRKPVCPTKLNFQVISVLYQQYLRRTRVLAPQIWRTTSLPNRLPGPGAMLMQCAFMSTARSAWTRASMSLQISEEQARIMAGSVALQEAPAARLSLFKPSIGQVQDPIEKRPPRISPGVSELIEKLKARNTDVYLVSGGFQQMIKKCRYKSLVMIGDGATDPEARQPGEADLFI